MDTLAQRLQDKLARKGISAFQLEKKAGLKRSAVNNIIYGRSKNPGIDIMIAIADGLECSLNELVRQEPFSGQNDRERLNDETHPYLENAPENILLYAQVLKCAGEILEKNAQALSRKSLAEWIEEIYNYASRSKDQHVDYFFAEWLLEKILQKEIL